MIDWNKYVGIPYKINGRNFDGCDCWGLVCLVYRYEFGIDIDKYFYKDLAEGHDLIAKEKKCFMKIEKPAIGDLVLFNIGGKPSHIGIVIGTEYQKNLLHTVAEHDSAIDRYNSVRWIKRIEGFYHVS